MSTSVEPLLPLTEPVPSLRHYLATGGGQGLAAATRRSRESVLDEVRAAGLRDRGGAGFETAAKWSSAASRANPVLLGCDATEAGPGTFKDRHILRRNPYRVLEGLAIAAHAIGATRAFIAVKPTFETEIRALCRALDEVQAAGRLGPASVRLILCAEPRCGEPAMVENVETLAHIPEILRRGAAGFRASGTHDSPGTTVFTLSGDVRLPGVHELPLGVPLRMLVGLFGGGTAHGRKVKAVFGGAAAAPLTEDHLDTPLDFASLRAAGSALGSAGFVVYDDSACAVAATLGYAKFLGLERITGRLERIERGDGKQSDVDGVLADRPPPVVRGAVRSFAREFTAHLGRPCPSPRDLPTPELVDFDDLTGLFRHATH